MLRSIHVLIVSAKHGVTKPPIYYFVHASTHPPTLCSTKEDMAAVGLMSLHQLESVQEEEELTHKELNDDHRDMNAQSYIKEPIPPTE